MNPNYLKLTLTRGSKQGLWPVSTRSSRVHREAALSRPSRCFKVGASERSPPLWPGINAALTLQGDADRFTREARAGKGVYVLNRFRCTTASLQNYSIIAPSFLRNCGKNVTPQPASLLLPSCDLRGHANVFVSKKCHFLLVICVI